MIANVLELEEKGALIDFACLRQQANGSLFEAKTDLRERWRKRERDRKKFVRLVCRSILELRFRLYLQVSSSANKG